MQIQSLIRRVYPSVGTRVVFPFLFIVLIVAAIGVFTVSRLVAGSIQERFNNQLLDSAAAAHNAVVDIERQQLANLRLMVFVSGISNAVVAGDTATVDSLLRPIAANAGVDAVVVYDNGARGLFYLKRLDEAVGIQFDIQQPPDVSTWVGVTQTLAGQSDLQGDKFVDLVNTPDGALFYWSAPLKDADGNIVGGVAIGLRVARIVQMVGNQALSSVALYDQTGAVIGSTFRGLVDGELALSQADLNELNDQIAQSSPLVERTLNHAAYQLLYSPLELRGESAGLMVVGLPSNFLVERTGTSRDVLSTLFAVLFVVVLALGILTARSITSPLRKLVSTTRAISDGHLGERAGLQMPDELGELSSSFDAMTTQLVKRNHRIHHLYKQQREETARHETVLANIGDAVFVQDNEGRTVMSNLAAQDLLNRAQSMPSAWARLQALFEAPERLTNSEVLEVGDYLYSIVAQFIYTQSHDQLGSVIVCRDVTAMARAERLKDELILQMSHELRTPLTAVKGYLDLMRLVGAKNMSTQSSEYLGKASDNLGILERLTNQVVDVSSIIADRFIVDCEPFDLIPVLEKHSASWQPRMVQRGLDFEVVFPGRSICVEGDPQRMGEAIDHILRNAFDYTLPGGHVEMAVYEDGPRAIIMIVDTGVGIARDEIDYVFDRMFRGQAANAGVTDSRGMGLGLYLSRHIIERQGGQISLGSQVGEGTYVRIELKLAGVRKP